MKLYTALILSHLGILIAVQTLSIIPSILEILVFMVFFAFSLPILMNPAVVMDIEDIVGGMTKGFNARSRRLKREAKESANTIATMRTNREEAKKLDLAMLMRWEERFRQACGHDYQRDVNSMDYAVWWDEENKRVQKNLMTVATKNCLTFLVKEDGALPILSHMEPRWRYYQFLDQCRRIISSPFVTASEGWINARYEVEQIMISEGLDPNLPHVDQVNMFAVTRG